MLHIRSLRSVVYIVTSSLDRAKFFMLSTHATHLSGVWVLLSSVLGGSKGVGLSGSIAPFGVAALVLAGREILLKLIRFRR